MSNYDAPEQAPTKEVDTITKEVDAIATEVDTISKETSAKGQFLRSSLLWHVAGEIDREIETKYKQTL